MLRVVSSFLLVALLSIGLAAAQSSQPGVGPETVAQHYGYITVNTTRHLYYWMFESRNDPAKDPFVLWMTGGPGCSSMLALFYENGPYNINPDLSLSLNPYSWNNNATVLFIDQPVGTGFSYADSGDFGVVTEEQMADNMYEFFQNFFAQFPQYANLPFFVFGESYAGHYVPAFSARILEGNQRNEGAHINLVGSAIGNGLVDPQVQYGEYWRYAQDHNLVSATSLGMMKGLAPVCQALISGCAQNSTLGWLACINAYTMCNMAERMPVPFTNINLYDVREQCKVPPLCYDFSLLPKYLSQPEVSKALGVVKTWQDCNRIVDMKMVFAGDWMLNFAQDIPKLLAAGHRVLVYAGEYDFICNWYGNHAWMQQLQWPGQAAFNQAPNATWAVDGVPAGVVQGAQGLTFLKVLNAGHMVPHDQPKNSYMMMLQFLTGEL